jgi:peptide/nickel transport system ATP-binding protein
MDGYEGSNHVLKCINLSVEQSEIWGIVGETGSGKSMTALSVCQLVPSPPGRFTSGSILLEGHDLMCTSEAEMHKLRGSRIGMIFQDPTTYLNPAFRIGTQLVDVALSAARNNPLLFGDRRVRGYRHRRRMAKKISIEMLDKVGIPDAQKRFRDYPHQFSGGQKQRILISMALIGQPKLLIADEPTTALDVSVQAQVLSLIWSIKQERDLTVLFISHDLGVVAQLCSHVAVMLDGEIVEQGPIEEIFESPGHEYTRRLLASLPSGSRGERLDRAAVKRLASNA